MCGTFAAQSIGEPATQMTGARVVNASAVRET